MHPLERKRTRCALTIFHAFLEICICFVFFESLHDPASAYVFVYCHARATAAGFPRQSPALHAAPKNPDYLQRVAAYAITRQAAQVLLQVRDKFATSRCLI